MKKLSTLVSGLAVVGAAWFVGARYGYTLAHLEALQTKPNTDMDTINDLVSGSQDTPVKPDLDWEVTMSDIDRD